MANSSKTEQLMIATILQQFKMFSVISLFMNYHSEKYCCYIIFLPFFPGAFFFAGFQLLIHSRTFMKLSRYILFSVCFIVVHMRELNCMEVKVLKNTITLCIIQIYNAKELIWKTIKIFNIRCGRIVVAAAISQPVLCSLVLQFFFSQSYAQLGLGP